MFKVAAVVLMLVVACNAFIGNIVGGYTNYPDFLNDEKIQGLISYATEYLSQAQNIAAQALKAVNVQYQVVNGINYKIDFIVEPIDGVSDQTTKCQVVTNVQFNSATNIIQADCQTS